MARYKFSLLILTILILLTACRNDDEPEIPAGSTVITLGISSKSKDLKWTPIVTSRDAAQTLEANMPETIGVWAYNDLQAMSYSGAGEVFRNRQMYYKLGSSVPDDLDLTPFEDNNWPYYNPEPWIASTEARDINYKFYSYSPYFSSAATSDGTPYVEAIGQAYSNFTGIIMHNLPLYTSTDITVGKELIAYKSKKASQGLNDTQHMTHMHLMARLRLCFKLGEEYSDLRIVRIRSIEMLNYARGLHNIVVDFSKNPVVSTPRTETSGAQGPESLTVYYEKQPNDADDIDFLELSKANRTVFSPFSSVYTLPKSQISSIRIRVHYDVYDTTGQLLRKNETAENDIALPFGLGGNRTIEAGYYYDVNVRVVPTFLYSLSDNDPQFEGPTTDGFLEMNE